MPSDSERKAVKTIPLMTCTNKDCSCTGMDFCNVLPECANCGACGMPLSIKKRSPKPNNRNPSHAVTTVLDDLASATARIAELEAMVRELVAWGDYDLEAISALDWPTVRAKVLALLE